MLPSITDRLATELEVRPEQVAATLTLLDAGATVPFIARYRKEVTGSLDDNQLRQLAERLHYLRELEERRKVVVASIDEQGKLDPALRQQLESAETRSRLEDLYLPYRPRRVTKAQIAREAGLEPLADALLADPTLDPELTAGDFVDVDKSVADAKAALDGARQILMERFAEDADLIEKVRKFLLEESLLVASVVAGKEADGAKFRDYFEHHEPLSAVPSHRALAMFRGRNEGYLHLALQLQPEEDITASHPCEAIIAEHWHITTVDRAADKWLAEVVRWTWRIKLLTHIQTDLLGQLRARAEAEAITVFATNLKDLLLAAPAGPRVTIGLDPGLRTGVKLAVVDATGKVIDHGTIFPHGSQQRSHEAEAQLRQLIERHGVELIAIGNGTAGRETDQFVGEVLKAAPERAVDKVMVNEAGASIYSASEFAAREFPDLDVTIRGAVSIARRLQDPLAELVKIDPRSIGVGQYQYDVSQLQLARQLDAVVEDCVNAVGVDLNMASAPLLGRVAGLTPAIADNVVSLRDERGAYRSRSELLEVRGLGPRTFEQAAGFLKIAHGDNPLDGSAVHPESYPVVEAIARKHQRDVAALVGAADFIRSLSPADYVTDNIGLPTVVDILAELEKPGRDPRPQFAMARFQEGVNKIGDLVENMVLEGCVTNVTSFGAFVDIGVHQDGLVHISALASRFVKDPHEIVKAGDVVKVKVMNIDAPRQRIGLSMRLDDMAEGRADGAAVPVADGRRSSARSADDPRKGGPRKGGPREGGPRKGGGRSANKQGKQPEAGATGAFAEAFARARSKND
jgi:uncharacterized protein